MVPTSHGSYTENRGLGQPGYMWSNIRNELNGVEGFCGIYEFQVRGGTQSAVVYVGSTCPRQADGGQCRRLKNRIINYCRHGNHKADLINYALSREYELWVHYKQAGSLEQAQAWENALLAMYNYAWNVRNNGNGVRKNFSRPVAECSGLRWKHLPARRIWWGMPPIEK